MPWDSDKSTAADQDNPNADEQLTAAEWDAHVTEGHFPADELNLGVNGSGDPVITDPQNGDAVVLRYDRSAGQWVLPALSTEKAVITDSFDPVFAQSEYYADFSFTLDGKFTSATGSANIAAQTQRYNLATGGTASSTAELLEQVRDFVPDYNRDIKARFRVNVGDASEIARVGVGRVNAETADHIGFIWEGGVLKGSTGDGSHTETQIDGSPTTGSIVDLYLHSDGSTVSYWVDKNPNTNAADGSISANIPPVTDDDEVYGAYLENPDGVNFTMELAIAEVYVE